MEFFDRIYWHNTVSAYAIGLGIAVATLLGVYVARAVVLGRLKRLAEKTHTKLDDVAVAVVRKTRFWAVLLLALYVGSQVLRFPPKVAELFQVIAVGAFAIQAGLWASAGITLWVDEYRRTKLEEGDVSSVGAVALIGIAVRIIAWILVVLLILDNIGVNVTALVAGVGIGGIAIALAVKDILQDILSSISIMLDRPFEVGDYILVGDLGGTVEHIGLKSTRLRASSGEQLVFGNDDLLGSRIRNMKRMNERRVVMDLRVSYDTKVDTLASLPDTVRTIVEAQEDTRFDRSHFLKITESAYLIQTVFYMTDPSSAIYNATQERINLEVLRAFEGAGVSLAYPTQTVHVAR